MWPRLERPQLLQPEEGLKQAGKIALQAIERTEPVWSRFYEARRKLATAAISVLAVWLFFHVVFGANGMMVYEQKRTDHRRLENEIDLLQKANDQYAQRIQALKNDPQAIEKEAREQLRYARPGEVIYVVPGQNPAPKPGNNAARN